MLLRGHNASHQQAQPHRGQESLGKHVWDEDRRTTAEYSGREYVVDYDKTRAFCWLRLREIETAVTNCSTSAAPAKVMAKVAICAQCHPFFTGKQKFVDTEGRVDRFRRRYNLESQEGEE